MSGYCMLNKNEYDSISPMLSVIIPVYNVEPYIHQCFDSLVNQTFKDIEIICIDDGSSDNSGTICDEYAQQNNGVIFKIIHKKNEGVAKARNDGINIANGKFLTFVDSDDWLNKDFYERIFAALDNREADVFCSGGRYIEYSKSAKMEKLLDLPFFYQKGEHRAEIIASYAFGTGALCKKAVKNYSLLWGMYYLSRTVIGNVIMWMIQGAKENHAAAKARKYRVIYTAKGFMDYRAQTKKFKKL